LHNYTFFGTVREHKIMKGIVTSPVNMQTRAELGIRAGDMVRVHQKVQEKGKTRLQVFEGLVLVVKHGREPGATFTVRKVASGVGVEKTFPLYSPVIDKIEIVRRSKVRRAKLYHIREQVAREAKRTLRRMKTADISTASDTSEGENVNDAVKEETKEKPTEETAVTEEKPSDDTQDKKE
jgi:large subunit ribosomal protein L19